MQKIQYIKNYKDKSIGEIETVENNIAHGLVDNGLARLYQGELLDKAQNTMIKSDRKRRRIQFLKK